MDYRSPAGFDRTRNAVIGHKDFDLTYLGTQQTHLDSMSIRGSGSALIWVAGSGSRRGNMIQKNRKKYRIFMFWNAGCSLLRAEGFSCSLGVLYWDLEIRKLQFLIKKIKIKIASCKFFFNFRSSSNPVSGSRIRIRNPHPQLEKMLDPDPHQINADPQPWWEYIVK
jgi:hypothetical protein